MGLKNSTMRSSPGGVAFEVPVRPSSPGKKVPARLSHTTKNDSKFNKEVIDNKLKEAEKRRKNIQESKIQKVKRFIKTGIKGSRKQLLRERISDKQSKAEQKRKELQEAKIAKMKKLEGITKGRKQFSKEHILEKQRKANERKQVIAAEKIAKAKRLEGARKAKPEKKTSKEDITEKQRKANERRKDIMDAKICKSKKLAGTRKSKKERTNEAILEKQRKADERRQAYSESRLRKIQERQQEARNVNKFTLLLEQEAKRSGAKAQGTSAIRPMSRRKAKEVINIVSTEMNRMSLRLNKE